MDDWEYTECLKCGSQNAKLFTCWDCGGEGGDYPHEYLPIEYDEDEFEVCDICKGVGSYVVCPDCPAPS